jgi:nicotinamide-nucleotide amidase
MKTEIISIGDELLIGQVINTNASWMAEQLKLAGIEVIRITTISDTGEEIRSSLREASSRADILLLTGGLGPTKDDITKSTLCEYFDTKLVFHQPSYDQIEKLFGDRGYTISDVNRQQAYIPDNCTPILNENGTAPGMRFEKDGKIIISMPGVPFEMKGIMTDFVLPELSKKLNGHKILHKVVLTQGVGESFLAETISDWESSLPAHMKLAYLPQPGIVRLRISGSGPEMDTLEQELDEKISQLEKLIPELIFGYGEDTLEAILGKVLLEKGKTISTAESCTGGYIAHLITSIAGSSSYYKGSVVAYANEVKMDMLGVKEETLIAHGAVSEETVKEMAAGAIKRFNTDYAIAISGIAGPDGGTEEKPVGTVWIAVAGPSGTFAKKYLFGKNRQRNIRVAALTALNAARKIIANA